MATIQTLDVTNLQLSTTIHECSISQPLSNLRLRVTYFVHVSRGSEEISEGLAQHCLKGGFQKAFHKCFHDALRTLPISWMLPASRCILPASNPMQTPHQLSLQNCGAGIHFKGSARL